MTEEYLQDKEWSQIVARAWADQTFRTRLLADPATVLSENGVALPPGVKAKVHENADDFNAKTRENSDDVRHFILPPSPAGELSEEELSPTLGAYCYCGRCRRCGRCGRCGCGCDRA